MQKEEITLVMCVKNESKGLKQAVDSVLEYVGDIVIGVDSLSDDRTFEIAHEITQNVIMFRWQNDFAQMRNEIASYVKTPWILILDGHEYLAGAIDYNEIQDPEVDGILMRVRLEGGQEFLQPRILRREVKFVGKIHNAPQLKKPATMRSGIIVHDRKNSQTAESIEKRTEQRNKMMKEIMEKDLKKNKKDTRAAFHLGMYYHGNQKFKKAKKYYEQFLKYSQDSSDRFTANLNLALCLFKLKKLKQAEKQIKKGVAESGRMWEYELVLGTIYCAMGKHGEAIRQLIFSFEPNEKPQRDFPFRREPAKTWDMIANEFFQIKLYADAAQAWQKASEQTDDEIARALFRERSKLMLKMQDAIA